MGDLAAILNAVRGGDRRAWEALVRDQTRRLHAIAWAVTHDGALAEDVVQEVFLKVAWGRLPRGPGASAQGFLNRMAARVALDALRRQESRRRREKRYAGERYAMERESRGEGPDKALESEECVESLRDGFSRLDAESRAALWLHHVEGEGIREVAEALGRPRSTAADRIRSGTERLREFLRGRGFAVTAVLPLPDLLRRMPPREPGPGLLVRLEALGEDLAPHVAVLPAAALAGGLIMSGKKVAAAN